MYGYVWFCVCMCICVYAYIDECTNTVHIIFHNSFHPPFYADAGFSAFAEGLQAAETDPEVKALGESFKQEMKKLNPKFKAQMELAAMEEDNTNPEAAVPN